MSVVMPIRNGEAYVEEQLAALAAQSFEGAWELVVVDNGCSDRSMEIVERWRKRFPSLTVVDASQQRGLNYARNRGAAGARGDFLAYCDADDVAEPEWLEGLVEAGADADIVAGRADGETLNAPDLRAWRPAAPTIGVPVRNSFLPSADGGNCGIWAPLAREIGWDESFTYAGADIEFSWRAQLAGRTIGQAPRAVMNVRYRDGLRPMMRQYFHYGKSEAHLFRRFRGRGMPSPGLREGLRTWWWLFRRSPGLLRSRQRRGHWLRLAALSGGRAVGSIRWRVLYLAPPSERPTGTHLLEFGVRWPPETFVSRRLERLSAAGFRVTVASLSDASDARPPPAGVDHVPLLREGRSPLHVLADALVAFFGLSCRSPRRALTVARAAARPAANGRVVGRREAVGRLAAYARLAVLKPDLVHFEWMSAAVECSSLVDALGRPAVVSCHNLDVFPYTAGGRRTLNGLASVFGRAAAVHCVSETTASAAAALGLDPHKVRVIRAAVDPGFFRPPRASLHGNGRFQIVAVGTLRWVKGFEYALLSVAELAREGIPVSLDILGGDPLPDIGEPSERERILAAVSDLGLEESVRLHGRVLPRAVRDRLQTADVFLQSSVSEGHPTAVVEAMACGLPVVATDCGGTRETFTNGVEGYLVPPRDWRSAATALRALQEDPGLRTRMGRAGRARIEAHFTLDLQTESFVELYEQVLARCS